MPDMVFQGAEWYMDPPTSSGPRELSELQKIWAPRRPRTRGTSGTMPSAHISRPMRPMGVSITFRGLVLGTKRVYS